MPDFPIQPYTILTLFLDKDLFYLHAVYVMVGSLIYNYWNNMSCRLRNNWCLAILDDSVVHPLALRFHQNLFYKNIILKITVHI